MKRYAAQAPFFEVFLHKRSDVLFKSYITCWDRMSFWLGDVRCLFARESYFELPPPFLPCRRDLDFFFPLKASRPCVLPFLDQARVEGLTSFLVYSMLTTRPPRLSFPLRPCFSTSPSASSPPGRPFYFFPLPRDVGSRLDSVFFCFDFAVFGRRCWPLCRGLSLPLSAYRPRRETRSTFLRFVDSGMD